MKYTKHRIPWIREPTLLKDSMIILGWVVGLILLSFLFWYFAQPVKNRFLISSVNQILQQSGDPRRLSEPITRGNIRTSGFGSLYNFSDNKKVLIFTFIGEGTFFPCAAVMDADGRIEEIFPLGRHSARMFQRVSPEILNIYTMRINSQRINSQRIEQGRS